MKHPEVWFTADTHFGHVAMVEKGWRPGFATIDEHDEAIITRWNENVRPQDIVWHLGDWGLGPRGRHLEIVKELHGTIHLIAGNHDPVHPSSRSSHKYLPRYLDAGFASVQAFARRRFGKQEVLLSHFPYEGDHTDVDRYGQYRLVDNGLPLLCGHVHRAWRERGRMLNVGIDAWPVNPVHTDIVHTWVEGLAS